MNTYDQWSHPYPIDQRYGKRVAYFSMEFAIAQSLKIYSGGLGFLAGSHMRSAYELKQNLIGIGMLWKFGYYDQERNEDQTLRVHLQRKYYPFLRDSGITVKVTVNSHPVYVKALYLAPEIFNTAPIYLLTTDIPENDFLAQTITHRLYDGEHAARVAQSIVLGIGGAKLVEALGGADIYHMNEAHAMPMAFQLMEQLGDLDEVRNRVVLTTHTPELAGNQEHEIGFLRDMGYFNGLSHETVVHMTGMDGNIFSHTLAALRVARVSNAVSRLHGEVSNQMWGANPGICKIQAITNAQNRTFWQDPALRGALDEGNDAQLVERKKQMKDELFKVVADQTGKRFDRDTITVVWARRFAAYKRADLLIRDIYRFTELINRSDRPVQVIWAGKPFPTDHGAIEMFDKLVRISYKAPNFAVLTGYEIELSRLLKQGADVWLNTPRRPREASGTSGMTAAMNGAVNLSINDGWIPEFARHGENSFIIPIADPATSEYEQDEFDYQNLMRILEHEVVNRYYDDPQGWLEIAKQGMRDVVPAFDSNRMAHQYYEQLYNAEVDCIRS
ncbi:alpha-glucan family phosphorylase [Pseudomonas saliphila]|uniref:alpha-glucan family phosphorylase n=1 Tax=Pseudomonas saliphila TaxID=2586906 RepID=UPI00123AC1D4|nr:alpha-glucan family phosphorylase [Pseudomonas saliphila]